MTHTIQNGKLRVKINAIGAELNSIIRKSDTKELLWQGDPEFWTGQAPVLFPNIGKLKDDEHSYKDTTYSLAKHGFIKHHKNLEAHQTSDSKCGKSPKLCIGYRRVNQHGYHCCF